jgi:hypothetical protein
MTGILCPPDKSQNILYTILEELVKTGKTINDCFSPSHDLQKEAG